MGLLRSATYVFSAFIYLNFFVYLFHSIIAKKLGPEGYGEFTVVYSFMFVVGYLTSLLITVSIKNIIENFSRRYEFLQSLRLVGLLAGVLFALLGFSMAEIIRDFLNVKESYYFHIVSLSWLVLFVLVVEKSFLQATDKFGVFALCNGAEITIRVIFAYLLLQFGFRVEGALFSYLMGIIFVLIFLLIRNGGFHFKRAKLDISKIIRVALYASPMGFFIYADDIFIRRIFEQNTAGIVASVLTVGKFLLWSVIALLDVFFPKFVETKGSFLFKKHVFQLFIIAIFIEFVMQITMQLIGENFIVLIFGERFKSAYMYLSTYLFALLPLVLSIVFINVAIALEKGILFIYIHAICFYLGFLIFKFETVDNYLRYIFAINLPFLIFYFYLFRRELFLRKS
ncbi:MAG: hypothetical protein RMI30_02400 [Thermodesulfovibrio sp.]|nr:hypothetical protein [Thermodesulfovibrio sp.]MDW7998287.1 hypothetical protein [Thermodesulfovibrio sp.]